MLEWHRQLIMLRKSEHAMLMSSDSSIQIDRGSIATPPDSVAVLKLR
jgi:hypothetical protein